MNTVHLIRYWFEPHLQYYYVNNITTSHFRASNTNQIANGALAIQVYLNKIYAMYSNHNGFYKMDLCRFRQSYSDFEGCKQCPFGTFAPTFNSKRCSSCETKYGDKTFENFLKLKYCPEQVLDIKYFTDSESEPEEEKDSTPPSTSTNEESKAVPNWIIGVVIALIVLAVIFLVILTVCLVKRR